MEHETSKVKKYAYVIGLGTLGLIGLVSLDGGSTPQTQQAPAFQQTSVQTTVPAAQINTPGLPTAQSSPTQKQDQLSNDNYYINSSGNTVHSPAYDTTGDVPAGATAQCGDGTYSFSQHRSGTCSHHGGVSRWLN